MPTVTEQELERARINSLAVAEQKLELAAKRRRYLESDLEERKLDKHMLEPVFAAFDKSIEDLEIHLKKLRRKQK